MYVSTETEDSTMCFQTYLVSVVERREIRYMDQWNRQSLFLNPEDYRRLRPQEPAARRIGRHELAPALSISPGHYAVQVWLAAPLSLSEDHNVEWPSQAKRSAKARSCSGLTIHRQVNRKKNNP
jgi:hypothetical protein